MPALPAVLSLALGIAMTAVPAPASTAAETCRGLPATIVGGPTGDVDGTEGDDVVVATFAPGRTISLGSGDDVLCVAGTAADGGTDPFARLQVTLAAGDDVVDTTALDASVPGVTIWPGTGHDAVYGGPRRTSSSSPTASTGRSWSRTPSPTPS